MNYSYVASAHSIQIEISTKCNAQCPACIRTDSRSLSHTQEVIPQNKEMPIEKITEIFSSQFAQKLKTIEFCGTMDEPLMHSNFFEILDEIYRLHSKVSVSIHTNAGLRNEEFFTELAKKLQRFGEGSCVKFSIDGLEDTNFIYRYGVKWDRVYNNLIAFINAGGKAEWQMLIFPWNQHQVALAKQMAQDLGCVAFKARPDRTMSSAWGLEKILKMRAEKVAPNRGLRAGDPAAMLLIDQRMSDPVDCVYRDIRQMIFISWDAQVWPCCFWTNIRYENALKKQRLQETVFAMFGSSFNSLDDHTLDEILAHSFFTKDLVKSWSDGSQLKWRCVDKCSKARVRAGDGKPDDKKPYEFVEFS